VPEIDEKELDSWDGVNLGFYSKIKIRVQTLDGDVLAWLYVLDAYEGGLPSDQRLSILVDAAIKAGAPEHYVGSLRRRPRRPPTAPAGSPAAARLVSGALAQDGPAQRQPGDDARRDRGPVPGRGRRRRLDVRRVKARLLAALGERGHDAAGVDPERVALG